MSFSSAESESESAPEPELSDLPVSWRRSSIANWVEVPVAGPTLRSIELQHHRVAGGDAYALGLHYHDQAMTLLGTPNLELTMDWCGTDPIMSHMVVGEVGELDPTKISFDASGATLRASATAEDLAGRVMHLDVCAALAKRRPSVIPATKQTTPVTMRYLHQAHFQLLARSAERVHVDVDGIEHEPRGFLVPGTLSPRLSARVGLGALAVGLDGTVPPVPGDPAASPMRIGDDDAWFAVRFSGSAGATDRGELTVESHLGPVASGSWERVRLDGERYRFVMNNVDQNWAPAAPRLSERALGLVRRMGRRDETWRWSGTYRSSDDVLLEGGWTTN